MKDLTPAQVRAEEFRSDAQGLRERGDTSEWADELDMYADSMDPRDDEEVAQGEAGDDEDGEMFSDIEPIRNEWLWKNRIPFSDVTLVVGDSKIGKSFLICDWINRITNGLPMPDGTPGVQGKVILIAPEDKAATITYQRLEASGANMKNVCSLSEVKRQVDGIGGTTKDFFTIPDDLPRLLRKIGKLKGVVAVFIDPIMAVANDRVSMQRNQTVRAKIIRPLQRIAYKTGVAIVVVGHPNKSYSLKNLKDGVGGSKGLTDAGRVTHFILRSPDDPRIKLMVCIANNYADIDNIPNMAYRIVSQGNSAVVDYISGFDPTFIAEQQAKRLSDDRRAILACLEQKHGYMSSLEIAQETDIDYDDCRRILTRMHKARPPQIVYAGFMKFCSIAYWREVQLASTNKPTSKKGVTSETSETVGQTQPDPTTAKTIILATPKVGKGTGKPTSVETQATVILATPKGGNGSKRNGAKP